MRCRSHVFKMTPAENEQSLCITPPPLFRKTLLYGDHSLTPQPTIRPTSYHNTSHSHCDRDQPAIHLLYPSHFYPEPSPVPSIPTASRGSPSCVYPRIDRAIIPEPWSAPSYCCLPASLILHAAARPVPGIASTIQLVDHGPRLGGAWGDSVKNTKD